MISADDIDTILMTLQRLARQARVEGDARLVVVCEALEYYIATGRCPTPFLVVIAREGVQSILNAIIARWNGKGNWAGIVEVLREYLMQENEK